MQAGEIVMDICQIGVSFISQVLVLGEPSPFFQGAKLTVYNGAYEVFFSQGQSPRWMG